MVMYGVHHQGDLIIDHEDDVRRPRSSWIRPSGSFPHSPRRTRLDVPGPAHRFESVRVAGRLFPQVQPWPKFLPARVLPERRVQGKRIPKSEVAEALLLGAFEPPHSPIILAKGNVQRKRDLPVLHSGKIRRTERTRADALSDRSAYAGGNGHGVDKSEHTHHRIGIH